MVNADNSIAGRDRRVAALAGSLALAALTFLVWLVYFAVPAAGAPAWADYLPASDAVFNSGAAACALAGFWAIRRRRRSLHQALMLVALGCSAGFLAGYVLYHHFHGETHFKGSGALRTAYLCLLASHVALSAVVLPLLLGTVAFAGLGVFERHRRLARWTLPLWLYVSVSGVAVYFFLRSSY
jgi:putative membrane protein